MDGRLEEKKIQQEIESLDAFPSDLELCRKKIREEKKNLDIMKNLKNEMHTIKINLLRDFLI